MTTNLMQAFDFTEHDLERNKLGVLSERQTKRFKRRHTRDRILALVLMVGVLIGAWFALDPYVTARSSAAGPSDRLIGGIVLLIFAFILLLGIFGRAKMNIQRAEGIAQFVQRESDHIDADGHHVSSTISVVVIGDYDVKVKTNQYQYFTQGDRYAIYYNPGTLGVLSIEHLGDG